MTKFLAPLWEKARYRQLVPFVLFSIATLSLYNTPCGVLSQ